MSESRVTDTHRLSGRALAWLSATFGPRRFLILLKALVIFLVLSPLTDGPDSQGFGLLLLSTLLALTTIYVAGTDRRYYILGVGLASLWAILGWSSLFWIAAGIQIAADLVFILLSFIALSVAFQRVFSGEVEEVDTNLICGGIAVYLLLGITWALSYRVIEQLNPGSFSLAAPNGDPAWSEILYFSYTTLTTLGYGDIVPLKPFARIWAMMETVTGTLYIAILVARLVSLYRR